MRKGFLIFLLILFSGCGLFFFLKKSPTIEPVAMPHTWSHFTEEGQLKMLLTGFNIHSMLDIPCADLQDLGRIRLGLKRYIGVAPTKEEARALQIQYGSAISSYEYLDLTKDVPPPVDLIFCWDLFSNLEPRDVRVSLHHIKKSGAKFLLMRQGDKIDWTSAPYCFPKPIIQIQGLALWSIESLP